MFIFLQFKEEAVIEEGFNGLLIVVKIKVSVHVPNAIVGIMKEVVNFFLRAAHNGIVCFSVVNAHIQFELQVVEVA